MLKINVFGAILSYLFVMVCASSVSNLESQESSIIDDIIITGNESLFSAFFVIKNDEVPQTNINSKEINKKVAIRKPTGDTHEGEIVILVDDGDDDDDDEDSDESDDEDMSENVFLRKKPFKACLKKASKVCTKACKTAVADACNYHECKKKLKKTLKKECKRSCKSFFVGD